MSKRKLLELVEERRVSRLGRPAHADHRRDAAARLHAGSDPRLLRSHRRRQARERHRCRAARARGARRPEQARAARDGRAAPAPGRHRKLSRRCRSSISTSSTIRRTREAGTRKVPFSRELFIERDDFREDPPKKFFRLAPGREVRLRVRLLHHAAPASTRMRPRAKSPRCAAPTIPRRAAETRRTAGR